MSIRSEQQIGTSRLSIVPGGLVVLGFDDSGSSQLVWSVGAAGWSVILSSSTTTTTNTAIAYYV